MFDRVPNVTVSDWFASAEITARMLRTLGRIGPGGVIIADPYRRDFQATHSRVLDPATRTYFVIYGHADLTRDLAGFTDDYGDRAWEELVPAVDCAVWEGLDERAEDIAETSFVVTRLREHMRACGFDLNAAPEYRTHAGSGRRTVTDYHVHRAHPAITVETKVPSADSRAGLSLVRIRHEGRHVTGWPVMLRTQFTGARVAERVRTEADAYLRRPNT